VRNRGAIPPACKSNLFCLGHRKKVFSLAKTGGADEYIFRSLHRREQERPSAAGWYAAGAMATTRGTLDLRCTCWVLSPPRARIPHRAARSLRYPASPFSMRAFSAVAANIVLLLAGLGFGSVLRRLFPHSFSPIDRLALLLLGELGLLGTTLFCMPRCGMHTVERYRTALSE
jgi:hypothetical protein